MAALNAVDMGTAFAGFGKRSQPAKFEGDIVRKKNGKWICEYCLNKFKNNARFAGHLLNKHGVKGAFFIAGNCLVITSLKEIL